MKYALSLVVLFFAASVASAQTRTFAAGSFILDDGAGHTITITVPPGLSGSYVWPLPLSLEGTPSAYIAPGGSAGDLLRWTGTAWTPVSFIDSGATTGDFLSWNGTKWISTAAPATVTNGSSIGDLLRWNGSSWQPTAFIDSGSTVGDVLSWNGSKWTAGAPSTGTVAVNNGGTGQTSYTDGQLLIGNSVGNTLTKNTLTAGNGMTITNGNGSIAVGTTVTSMIIGQTASNMDNNANIDYYFPIGGTQGNNTDPGFKKAAMRVTRNCTVKNFYVDITAAPGSGNSHNFTVRDITTGTELPMLSISGTGTSGSDLVNTLSVNAGDIIVVKHTATSTPNNAEAVWSFDLQ